MVWEIYWILEGPPYFTKARYLSQEFSLSWLYDRI